MIRAQFDHHDHCTTPGWATYLDLGWRQRWCRHRINTPTPDNDYSPQAYTRCPKCKAAFRWYDDGSHHFGGINRYFANLTTDGYPSVTND